ncbi:MAG: hypothetical protein K1X47_06820 [Cyclobacteriaceae bacterium]|nr:hypothetical protein [Cyclobacteriaceae bacterium]
MRAKVLYVMLALLTGCSKDAVTPSNGDQAPELVTAQTGVRILGKLQREPQTNDEGFLEAVRILQVANGKVYAQADVSSPVTGITHQVTLQCSISTGVISDYQPVNIKQGTVSNYYFLEGEADNEYESLDITGNYLYRNGAAWSALERYLYPYTDQGGYHVLSAHNFNPTVKLMTVLNPFSEMAVYDFASRGIFHYAPKVAPIIGITYRSDLVPDEQYSLANPGHHRIIMATWALRGDFYGNISSPLKANDQMLIMTEATDVTTETVDYNTMVGARRMVLKDSIQTQQWNGLPVDYTNRPLIRLSQDEQFVWVLMFNTYQTTSVFKYDKLTSQLHVVVDQSKSLYGVPFDDELQMVKLSGLNALAVYSPGGVISRMDLDAGTIKTIKPTLKQVSGYNGIMSTPTWYNGKFYVLVGLSADLKGNGVFTYYYNVLEIDPKS